MLYRDGQGVPQDYAQAVTWTRKSADQGLAVAQVNLGLLYRDGHGVPQDYAQAAAWYRKAADQGEVHAQNNLGIVYLNGRGVPQNYIQAASWFRKSAEQGFALAQNNLGAMYRKGQGIIQNNIIAYALYNLSASQDQSHDNPALSNRNDLVSIMTEAEIESGQALTQKMIANGVTVAIDAYLGVQQKHSSTHQNKKQKLLNN
ncbi:hypothetical protein SFSGTM_20230 [Sulfuriferula nivalis]|uniref:Sel1 repeat family protein n=1 Tax=Sulfuriferula nivalis TaxID=2675298 RepID=A0A809RII2_9PROT|nr:hypothetical protein SFSGTM_20230 [Sulfuriferula nivalis]